MRHVPRHLTAAIAGLALTAGIVYTAETDTFTPAQRNFWSLQPVKKAPVPPVKNRAWVKTPIDSFVLAKLEEAGLQPNPPADRLTLLRRATIDLTVHYLRPHTSGTFTCTAKVVRAGKRIFTVSADVVNGEGKLIATGLSTYTKV